MSYYHSMGIIFFLLSSQPSAGHTRLKINSGITTACLRRLICFRVVPRYKSRTQCHTPQRLCSLLFHCVAPGSRSVHKADYSYPCCSHVEPCFGSESSFNSWRQREKERSTTDLSLERERGKTLFIPMEKGCLLSCQTALDSFGWCYVSSQVSGRLFFSEFESLCQFVEDHPHIIGSML